MAYVITDNCKKDFLCADDCSTSAIHPTRNEPDANTVRQLFIDPEACIDCGNCVALCPNDAIFPIDDLPTDKAGFAQRNAAYFKWLPACVPVAPSLLRVAHGVDRSGLCVDLGSETKPSDRAVRSGLRVGQMFAARKLTEGKTPLDANPDDAVSRDSKAADRLDSGRFVWLPWSNSGSCSCTRIDSQTLC